MIWAQIIGQPEEWNPTAVYGDDFENAAESVIVEFLQATDGEIKNGAVLVWAGEGDAKVEKIYDWTADFEIPDVSGMEEDEEFDVDGSIELMEREKDGD